MVDIGSHKLSIRRAGKGSPTVVIDVGIASQTESWGALQDRIAEKTHVCTYDRAGYGQSEPSPFPRHSGQVAEELRALLKRASVPGPYLLVGHSLGALNVQVYANKYPGDVVGIVLLDPPPLPWILGQGYPGLRTMADQMTGEWQKIANHAENSPDPQEKARASFYRTIASEHAEMFAQSAMLVAGIKTFGGLPVVVIASGKPNPDFGEVADEYQTYWVEQSRRLARKSTNGEFVFAEESSHNLHIDARDLVAKAILSAVSEPRQR